MGKAREVEREVAEREMEPGRMCAWRGRWGQRGVGVQGMAALSRPLGAAPAQRLQLNK